MGKLLDDLEVPQLPTSNPGVLSVNLARYTQEVLKKTLTYYYILLRRAWHTYYILNNKEVLKKTLISYYILLRRAWHTYFSPFSGNSLRSVRFLVFSYFHVFFS